MDYCPQHKHFVVLMERLVEHPLSHKEEEFIMKHRRKLMIQSFASDVPKVWLLLAPLTTLGTSWCMRLYIDRYIP